jgi:hypothetical protein
VEVVVHRFLTDWAEVAALAPHHLWTEATVRERFDWARPPGVHAYLVRVATLNEPVVLPLEVEIGGCKSWVDVPSTPPTITAPGVRPAMSEKTLAALRVRLGW